MLYLGVIAAVAALSGGGLYALTRANRVFRIRVRDGRVQGVRGQVAARTVRELADVARRARIERATILGVRESRRTRLVVRGVDDGTAQRLRNAFSAASRYA